MAHFGHLPTFLQYFPTEVVQIDLEWPISAILQLFQYFPTKMVQNNSEVQMGNFGHFATFTIFSY